MIYDLSAPFCRFGSKKVSLNGRFWSVFYLNFIGQLSKMCQIVGEPVKNRTTFQTNALAHFTLTLPENDGKLRAHQMVFCTKHGPQIYAKDTTLHYPASLLLTTAAFSDSNPNEKSQEKHRSMNQTHGAKHPVKGA
jgi:hypothetical protein